MACDKTKDRTKELLKKWRTMPEDETSDAHSQGGHNWSVHVWATWVKRYPSDEETLTSHPASLSSFQKEKLTHIFSHVYDMDRDDIIALQDLESFTERVRHYADWTTNCSEYVILQQIQQGFVETFILPLKPESGSEGDVGAPFNMNRIFLSIEDWLCIWDQILFGVKAFSQLPIWLQYFSKILFTAINKSGSGWLSKEELGGFYSSLMGYAPQKVAGILDIAYSAMTANGDMKLDYGTYKLCFANLFFGKFPNGPGQFVFGYNGSTTAAFPIDYSAMNTEPQDLEPYSALRSPSNRTSVIV